MKKKKKFKNQFLNVLFDGDVFPFVLAFSLIGILFVFIRMRGIELSYQYNEVNSKVDSVSISNKELKAHRAKLLNVNNLRAFADRFELKEPSSKQILVIP